MDDAEVDRVMATWRQGDCAIGELWFLQRVVTDAAGNDVHEVAVDGLVVLSQTCDIVRATRDRPVLELSALVVVEPADLRMISKGYRPRYAFLPALQARGLVADLDRVMTIEKRVVAGWPRTAGWVDGHDGRAFAAATGRKRTRFAFPDDFNGFVRKSWSLQAAGSRRWRVGSPRWTG